MVIMSGRMVILFALLSLLAITNGQEGTSLLISVLLLINITCSACMHNYAGPPFS